jgi:hypothetical protein
LAAAAGVGAIAGTARASALAIPGQFALDGRVNGPLTLPNGAVIQDGQALP